MSVNVNALIVSTLSSIAPTSLLMTSSKIFPYITFQQVGEQGGSWAENDERLTEYTYQVDVWSKDDNTQLVSDVKDALSAAGFRRTYSIDLYEQETATYHKSLRFIYSYSNFE
jgi:hypothetical protein